MGAAIVSVPEMELSAVEARQLNDAIKEVIKHHPVAVDPAKVAVFQLGIVAVGIYGGHFIRWRRRVGAEIKSGGRPTAVPKKQQDAPAEQQAEVPYALWPESAVIDRSALY